ncbi:MAG: DeoR/GlpR family DNA-binding transcription regulator [Planctomycetota bacterium]
MKNIRQQRILDWLSDHGHAALAELTQVAAARRLTIQRDLVELEQAGRLKRIRGGAVSIDQRWQTRPHEVRLQENRAAKESIATLAAAPLRDFQCVGLDGSSTCTFLAPALARPTEKTNGHAPRTVVATSIDTFMALRNVTGVQAVLSGGVLHRESGGMAGSLVGALAIQTIRSFHFDAVCISGMGFDPALGVYDSNAEDVSIKQALMSVAQRVFLLVDHTKWRAPQGVKVCETDALHAVITDRHPGAAAKQLPKAVALICSSAAGRVKRKDGTV